MAVNVDTVYKTVLYILNKEQRGYITPDEFDKLGTQVQVEIFEQYFEELNQQLRVPENDSEYANRVKNLEDKIEIFQRIANAPAYTVGPPAYFTIPTDLHRIGTVIYNGATEVQRVERNEYYLIKKSPLTAPTTSYPIYMYENSRMYIHPSSIVAPGDVEVSYTIKPISPRWGYSVGSLGQYIYDNTIYDSTTGSLVVFDNSLTSSITTNTVNGIDAVYTGAAFNTNAITTSGGGTGAQLTITVSGNIVTDVTVTVAGSGYAVGDTITISDSAPPNGIGGTTPVVITLTADDLYSTSSYGSTNFDLHPSEQTNLILQILMYSGVIIRDPQIIQSAAKLVQQDEIMEKS